jgi:hypothetical protein
MALHKDFPESTHEVLGRGARSGGGERQVVDRRSEIVGRTRHSEL